MATAHYTLHSTHSRLAAAWWPIPSCRASILSLLSLELSTPGEYRPRKQFQIQMSLQVQFAQALMALYTFLAQLAGWIAVLKQFITWHGTSPDHCPLSRYQALYVVCPATNLRQPKKSIPDMGAHLSDSNTII